MSSLLSFKLIPIFVLVSAGSSNRVKAADVIGNIYTGWKIQQKVMEEYFGQFGWREFNRNRKDILSLYDKIIEQTSKRPIKVAHGQGVEAYIRKWLSEFLPKKYGVTSGYIIPNLYNEELKLYHYDIIIFNQLEAPILWTESNEDQSENGKFRAIPAKHVMAVYEVKSRLTKLNITEAISKLNQTDNFKEQLNSTFSCGIIFIELKESDNRKDSIVKELINTQNIYGFSGGLILRFENDHSSVGRIMLLNSDSTKKNDNKSLTPISKPIHELNIYKTEIGKIIIAEKGAGFKLLKISEKKWGFTKSYSVMYSIGSKTAFIEWSRSNFADFCINLLSNLEGLEITDKNRPSFGRIFDNIELKKAPLQNDVYEIGKPFLKIKLTHNPKFKIDFTKPNQLIEYNISIENSGDVAAIFSEDYFKTKFELPSGNMANKIEQFHATINKSKKTVKLDFNKNPISIPFRLVYHAINNDQEFVSIEKTIKIKNETIELID